MLKIQEIRELIKLIDQSSIDEFKYEQNGEKITMRKQVKGAEGAGQTVVREVPQAAAPQPAPAAPQQAEAPAPQQEAKPEAKSESGEKDSSDREGLHAITSPMVGTFYEAPSPDSPTYVNQGDKVKPDSVVCIVEAMKLMNEIEAEVKGEVVEVLVENGQLVEYGQELFLVKPE
ncbi:acetyl-CoA carboxylase biotin carboxyl carrier protein [Alteribacter natronophilus]|uniref:acetyl-CoA carboxylase biotin carboxyl carrier protein n=1 Tax=Alteribacter natronophilus TaxID=2583810 RepID=UPI00110DD132|nr:acetyl-CoA carboxylase biotin carboxyl carrier protein [Alteribacter natronophilus]TMW73749.1 acetyl-CoA carboxylase biotin carboxyl carrier protein [Alteribacter natronophilus]